ncbi:MAG: hypothetical protein NZ932_03780 [Candidatus Bathyarchaeota archaeon]|nr:hypothetical protein [Candidatus Bathyarchaeota archaeon]MDW8022412.1 hypothetical protein [Nitrososphaerota archaeon]
MAGEKDREIENKIGQWDKPPKNRGKIIPPVKISPPCDGNLCPIWQSLTSPDPLETLPAFGGDRSQAHAGIEATAFLTKAVDAGNRLDRQVNGYRGASERTAFSPSGDLPPGGRLGSPHRSWQGVWRVGTN